MARVVICDYLKIQIGKDEQTHLVTIGDHEFEVGEEGYKALLNQFQGDAPPKAPKVIERIVEREPAPPALQAASPDGLEVEASDPFEQAPASPKRAGAADPDMLLEVPDDIKRRPRPAGGKMAEIIMEQATKFEEGSLPALTMGDKRQREATKKLRELEERENSKLKRKLDRGVNFNFNNDR